ncbi:helix-turn-helix domain-containing protein [Rugamonas sp. FT107W]|uniref:Helix-turn-helix domain-containing protein n=1 Tax=Duganella vulcania TaxID=2692166 RepID=A0A845HCX8_9BURK|nr:helix-turn-helix transcriptional regulator [Duganella vulcania]MYN16107.1 helix-turn-helix domain-containing protein [Duganella vulcania]
MHNKLGEFIRAHRERTRPDSVGLPDGGRRRTPGLRREELAQLCGVSPTWLTWLEQGREVQASSKMLARLAEVLRLSAAERAYLFGLADRLDPHHDDDGGGTAEALDAVVAAIGAPAYILDRQWDAVAWNPQAARLFAGWLPPRPQPQSRPNLLRYMFADAAARELIVDWPERARRLVAEFRADIGRHAGEQPLAGLIAELSEASATFAELWTLQDVVGREGGLRRFRHPRQGDLSFNQVTLHPAKRHDLKLVMLL